MKKEKFKKIPYKTIQKNTKLNDFEMELVEDEIVKEK